MKRKIKARERTRAQRKEQKGEGCVEELKILRTP